MRVMSCLEINIPRLKQIISISVSVLIPSEQQALLCRDIIFVNDELFQILLTLLALRMKWMNNFKMSGETKSVHVVTALF